jgi:hypothetical protein
MSAFQPLVLRWQTVPNYGFTFEVAIADDPVRAESQVVPAATHKPY